jgi:hypothetical protein
MVFSLFMGFRATRRYDANDFSSHRVGDKRETPTRHTDDRKAIFAVIFAIIQLLDRDGSLNTSRATSNVTP